MSTRSSLCALALLLTFSLLSPNHVSAQSSQQVSEALVSEIAAADSILFTAFNVGDLETLGTMFTRDLEFYHDQSGLTSYEENMEAFKLCP